MNITKPRDQVDFIVRGDQSLITNGKNNVDHTNKQYLDHTNKQYLDIYSVNMTQQRDA